MLLSDAEVTQLILMLGLGQETFTEAQAKRVIEWAEGVRLDMGLLENVLNGSMQLSVDVDNELRFQLTGKGMRST